MSSFGYYLPRQSTDGIYNNLNTHNTKFNFSLGYLNCDGKGPNA